jgi:hypothetical protein
MKKIILVLLLCFAVTIPFYACKKKETQPVPQTSGPVMPGQMPPGQMTPGQMPPAQMPSMGQQRAMPPGMMAMGKTQVVVPESVKGKWSAAKIIVEDKTSGARQEYTVKLNSDFTLPKSGLKIHVGDFLPDFRIDGLNLTSGSNEPRNPALAIRVFENNKQIFPAPGKEWGWLFEKVPSIHPFEHRKYAIFLEEGIKKG